VQYFGSYEKKLNAIFSIHIFVYIYFIKKNCEILLAPKEENNMLISGQTPYLNSMLNILEIRNAQKFTYIINNFKYKKTRYITSNIFLSLIIYTLKLKIITCKESR